MYQSPPSKSITKVAQRDENSKKRSPFSNASEESLSYLSVSDLKPAALNNDERLTNLSGENSHKKQTSNVPNLRLLNTPFSNYSQISAFNTDIAKYKKLMLMKSNLEKHKKFVQNQSLRTCFTYLKEKWNERMIKKVAVAKLGRTLTRFNTQKCKEFIIVFVERFQTHKQKLLKQGLLNTRRKLSNPSANKLPEKIEEEKEESLQALLKAIKSYKDLLDDTGTRDQKKSVLSNSNLKKIFHLSEVLNGLSLLMQGKLKDNVAAGFRKIESAFIKTMKEDEDLSQLRDFTNLLDKSNDLGYSNRTKTLAGNSYRKMDNFSGPSLQGRLFNLEIPHSNNVSGLSAGQSLEPQNNLNSSFDHTMKQWQTKLSSLNNILNKNLPSMKSKHLYKYLHYEHGLFQIFRISENAFKRSKLIAYEKMLRGQSRRYIHRKIIKNLINIYRASKRSLLGQFITAWKSRVYEWREARLVLKASEQTVTHRFNQLLRQALLLFRKNNNNQHLVSLDRSYNHDLRTKDFSNFCIEFSELFKRISSRRICMAFHAILRQGLMRAMKTRVLKKFTFTHRRYLLRKSWGIIGKRLLREKMMELFVTKVSRTIIRKYKTRFFNSLKKEHILKNAKNIWQKNAQPGAGKLLMRKLGNLFKSTRKSAFLRLKEYASLAKFNSVKEARAYLIANVFSSRRKRLLLFSMKKILYVSELKKHLEDYLRGRLYSLLAAQKNRNKKFLSVTLRKFHKNSIIRKTKVSVLPMFSLLMKNAQGRLKRSGFESLREYTTELGRAISKHNKYKNLAEYLLYHMKIRSPASQLNELKDVFAMIKTIFFTEKAKHFREEANFEAFRADCGGHFASLENKLNNEIRGNLLLAFSQLKRLLKPREEKEKILRRAVGHLLQKLSTVEAAQLDWALVKLKLAASSSRLRFYGETYAREQAEHEFEIHRLHQTIVFRERQGYISGALGLLAKIIANSLSRSRREAFSKIFYLSKRRQTQRQILRNLSTGGLESSIKKAVLRRRAFAFLRMRLYAVEVEQEKIQQFIRNEEWLARQRLLKENDILRGTESIVKNIGRILDLRNKEVVVLAFMKMKARLALLKKMTLWDKEKREQIYLNNLQMTRDFDFFNALRNVESMLTHKLNMNKAYAFVNLQTAEDKVQARREKMRKLLSLSRVLNAFLRNKQKYSQRDAFEKIRSASQLNYFSSYTKYKNKIEKMGHILESAVRRSQIKMKWWGYQSLIVAQHQKAFEGQNKFLRLMSLMKKSYLLMLARAFGIWKTDLDVCKTEFLLKNRLLNQHKIERERLVNEIINQMRQKSSLETEVIEVKREPSQRTLIPVSPAYSNNSTPFNDALDQSNISYLEQGENLPLKTLHPEIFEVFEERAPEDFHIPAHMLRPSEWSSKVREKNLSNRVNEDQKSGATQRKYLTKTSHRREVSDILSGYSMNKEQDGKHSANNIRRRIELGDTDDILPSTSKQGNKPFNFVADTYRNDKTYYGRNIQEPNDKARILREHNFKTHSKQAVDEHQTFNENGLNKGINKFEVGVTKLKSIGSSSHYKMNSLHSQDSYGSSANCQNNMYYEDRLPSKVLQVELLEEDALGRAINFHSRK